MWVRLSEAKGASFPGAFYLQNSNNVKFPPWHWNRRGAWHALLYSGLNLDSNLRTGGQTKCFCCKFHIPSGNVPWISCKNLLKHTPMSPQIPGCIFFQTLDTQSYIFWYRIIRKFQKVWGDIKSRMKGGHLVVITTALEIFLCSNPYPACKWLVFLSW